MYIYKFLNDIFWSSLKRKEDPTHDTQPIAKLPGGLVSHRHRATTSHGWCLTRVCDTRRNQCFGPERFAFNGKVLQGFDMKLGLLRKGKLETGWSDGWPIHPEITEDNHLEERFCWIVVCIDSASGKSLTWQIISCLADCVKLKQIRIN